MLMTIDRTTNSWAGWYKRYVRISSGTNGWRACENNSGPAAGSRNTTNGGLGIATMSLFDARYSHTRSTYGL